MQDTQNMQNIDKLFIGIDVSKKDLDVAYWQSHPQSKSIFLGKFPNSIAGFGIIVKEVEKKQQETNSISVFIVLEPTGGYEQKFAHFAHEKGWDVSLPNPKQVRDWIKGTGRRAKTDRIDALMLARRCARSIHLETYVARICPTGIHA
jgi:transposase